MAMNGTTLIFAQVLRASANHKVEHQSHLLRPKRYALPSSTVYLGDVATALITNLPQPETPHFSQPPGFNEQRWVMGTNSGTLSVRITSDSYWGFGLSNSGYLNAIELTGPFDQRMRLLFDLKASVGHNPWEFKHRAAANRWLTKHHPGTTIDDNEAAWRGAMTSARAEFEASIEIMEQRSTLVEKRMKQHKSEFVGAKATVPFHAAQLDLQVARIALADENAPAIERALARVEASLIEADPTTELLSSEHEASAPEGMSLRNDKEAISPSLDDLEIVDLTDHSQEEE
jgi:hypothetical protein